MLRGFLISKRSLKLTWILICKEDKLTSEDSHCFLEDIGLKSGYTNKITKSANAVLISDLDR